MSEFATERTVNSLYVKDINKMAVTDFSTEGRFCDTCMWRVFMCACYFYVTVCACVFSIDISSQTHIADSKTSSQFWRTS